MKFLKVAGAVAALAFSFATAGAANAAVYNLTVDGSSGGLGGDGNYGTVTVVSAANGGLDFTVALDPGVTFHSNGGHTSFAFTLSGDTATTVNVTSLSSGFVVLTSGLTSGAMTPGAYPDPSIGTFEYGLDCPLCTGQGPYQSSLHFIVTAANSSALSLVPVGTSNSLGAANLRITSSGLTGAVGFVGAAVPEASTWAMMILGLGMVGVGLRMRRRNALATA
ncbi:MAG: hypothetical protein JWO33_2300 [Caulobacteraceae bacterium]|nr:hypothetical protein [Caulobacteraceae bacterium]